MVKTHPEALQEQKRCSTLVYEKIDNLITERAKKGNKKFLFILRRLRDDLDFLINNPDYKRTTQA